MNTSVFCLLKIELALREYYVLQRIGHAVLPEHVNGMCVVYICFVIQKIQKRFLQNYATQLLLLVVFYKVINTTSERMGNMDWTILGIEPVKDKKAITAAYRAKLVQVNPEDKPEEFKALRAAYEEALQYAEQPDNEPVRDESPVGLWMEKVRAVYDDFPARIHVESWKELLNDDVCIALDKRPQAEEALLRFLMDDYYIPQEVWQLLDETFEFTSRQEELYENFPKDFIDLAVVNGIRYPAVLPYEMFTPGLSGKDCDDYRRLYHKASNMPPLEMGPILDQMEAMPESHPHGEALRFRWILEQGDVERATELYRGQAEQYPDDFTIQLNWAGMCARRGDWPEAEAATRHVLELYPKHWHAKRMLADALASQGQYDEAKELIYDLMRAAGGDQMQVYQLGETLKKWNEELIQMREQTLQEHPEDSNNALELGWCYLQNNCNDDALRAAMAADPNYEDQYAYHNLHAKLRYGREEFELALTHFERVEQLLRNMEPDGTEKTAKRLSRLPEIVQLEGSCLLALKRTEEGRAKYEEALEMAPDNAEILTHTARMYASLKEYDRAVPLLQRVIRLMPGGYHGYFLLAQVLYELGRDAEAFDAVNKALDIEGGDLWVYVLKMRILIRNNVWDGVRQMLDFLAQHNITDVLAVMWCKAQLTEFGDQNADEALAIYEAIADRIETGEYLEWASKVYHRIAAINLDRLDMNKQEDRDKLMAIVEKGLKHDPDDPNCTEYKAWLHKRNGEVKQSLALYHKLEKHPYHPKAVEHNLAELYYKDLKRNADQALHYYKYLIENDESADLHFYAGTCNRYLYDFEAAEQHFLREQELAPDDVDGYNGLAYVYEAMNRLPEALEQVNKAIALTQDRSGRFGFLYAHKAQVLRRMNRAQEAIDTVYEVMARYDYPDGYEMKFDIACQFDLWDKAKKMLEEWKAKVGNTNEVADASIRLQLMTGRMLKAKLELSMSAKQLDEETAEALKLQIADLNGDFKTVAKIWEKREKASEDLSHVLMNLAEAQLFSGDAQTSRRTAELALERVDAELKLHLTNETLYRTRRAMILALLGREDEARAELAKARSMPLCAGCNYCACKDADIFEVTMEEIFGNYRKARELCERYIKQWPDELDFVTCLNRLKKKG